MNLLSRAKLQHRREQRPCEAHLGSDDSFVCVLCKNVDLVLTSGQSLWMQRVLLLLVACVALASALPALPGIWNVDFKVCSLAVRSICA